MLEVQALEPRKRAKRRFNVRTKLAAPQLSQERADAFAYAATIKVHANTEALTEQPMLLVGGQVLASALAISCGSTASKPSAIKGQVTPRSASLPRLPHPSRASVSTFPATCSTKLHRDPDHPCIRYI
jgi:predicted HicB family RNase H-like nuclease